ncbi:MAG: hypothetical protein MJ025_00455 [Victivallaceae bacterium]|nr:hypothetical protein [Victivallaceae bacterium]
MSSDLLLDYGNGDSCRLRSAEAEGDSTIGRLADLLGLKTGPIEGHADAVLTRNEPYASSRLLCRCNPKFVSYYSDMNRFYVYRARKWGDVDFGIDCQRLVILGQTRAVIDGRSGDSNLIHGVMLDYKDGCIIMFGVSGIGKSTTLRRYVSSGGSGVADDMLLLTMKSGVLYAHPLPTWSAVQSGTAAECYPFPRKRRVLAMFLLLRDEECEHVEPADGTMFRIRMMQALSVQQSWLSPFLPSCWSDRLFDHFVNFGQRICCDFRPYIFYANLAFDVRQTICDFMESNRIC